MLLFTPILAHATSGQVWVPPGDPTQRMMVRLDLTGVPAGGSGGSVPVAIVLQQPPAGFDAAPVVAWSQTGGQLPVEVESTGTATRVVWVATPVPGKGSPWLWLDWSGTTLAMGGAFAEFASVHHFSTVNPGLNSGSEAGHTATFLQAAAAVSGGTLGDWAFLQGEKDQSPDLISIPFGPLLDGTNLDSSWVITAVMRADTRSNLGKAFLTGGTAWQLAGGPSSTLVFETPVNTQVGSGFGTLQARDQVIALRYEPAGLVIWLDSGEVFEMSQALQDLGPTEGLVVGGAYAGSIAGFAVDLDVDELRVYRGPRSDAWLAVDRLSMAGTLAVPCMTTAVLHEDSDDDLLCDVIENELGGCDDETSDRPDDPCLHTGDPPTDGGPTDGGTTDGANDTGPSLFRPFPPTDPGCACDSSGAGGPAVLLVVPALSWRRSRRSRRPQV